MSRAIEPLANNIQRHFAKYEKTAHILFDISVNGPERKCLLHAGQIPVNALGTGYIIYTDVDFSVMLSNTFFEVKLTPLNECSFNQYPFEGDEFRDAEITAGKGVHIRLSSAIEDNDMIVLLKKIVDIYISLYMKKQIKDRQEEFQKARDLLAKTKCAAFDVELRNELIGVIIQDMRKRLVDIKKSILNNKWELSNYRLRKIYYFDTELFKTGDEEERYRMSQIIDRSEVLGDSTMEEHFYSRIKNGGVIIYNAALILYILYYSKKGFSMLTYEDCSPINKLERILLRAVENDALDPNISVSEFKTKIDNVIYKLEEVV